MSAAVFAPTISDAQRFPAKLVESTRDLSTNWLTTEEINNHLNLFGDDSQDEYLRSLHLAARMAIEDYLGLSICAVSFTGYYASQDVMPMRLALPSVSQSGVTITTVRYYNNAATPALTTISAGQYFFDVTGNQVILNSVPSDINREMSAPLQVNWTNAASALGQYPVIKQAGLLMIGHLYNNRSDTNDKRLFRIPLGIEMLLKPYKPLVM